MQPRIKVTICGSFKRRPADLADIFLELETTGCRVLSPITLNFTNHSGSFVKLASEQNVSISEIEKFHLRAIAESDFIWLHNPDGYVGVSGAFELGYALALCKPIFAFQAPEEDTLDEFIMHVPSVYEALKRLPKFHSS
jgi:hypothetical protein